LERSLGLEFAAQPAAGQNAKGKGRRNAILREPGTMAQPLTKKPASSGNSEAGSAHPCGNPAVSIRPVAFRPHLAMGLVFRMMATILLVWRDNAIVF